MLWKGSEIMTKQEFQSGQPFRIGGDENIFRYSEKDGGELYQLIRGKWIFATVVTAIFPEKGYFITTGIQFDCGCKKIVNFNEMVKAPEASGCQ